MALNGLVIGTDYVVRRRRFASPESAQYLLLCAVMPLSNYSCTLRTHPFDVIQGRNYRHRKTSQCGGGGSVREYVFYVFFRFPKNMTFYVFFEMTYQKVVKSL